MPERLLRGSQHGRLTDFQRLGDKPGIPAVVPGLSSWQSPNTDAAFASINNAKFRPVGKILVPTQELTLAIATLVMQQFPESCGTSYWSN